MSKRKYDVVKATQKANPYREMTRLDRRILKLNEEAGELSQAYLHVSSKKNTKHKTWHDVREEAIDVAIVALDVALTRMPIDKKRSNHQIEEDVLRWFKAKLSKWEDNLKAQKASTEFESDVMEDDV
jgi:NTP pyrophosphatase (non-canonical NTP hydrolase)